MQKQIDEVMGLVEEYKDVAIGGFSGWDERMAIESKLRELLPVWVEVGKQKPEEDQQVWVRCVDANGKSTFQAYAIWADGDWFMDVMDSGDLYSRQRAINDGLDACTVTHWMQLPPEP